MRTPGGSDLDAGVEPWPALAAAGVERCWVVRDPPSGLFAVVVIDDVRLGPAAGGVRTRAYPSLEAALCDAAALARAMTIKCALAGLDAGGGKAVVLDHPGLDRARGFAILGQRIDELGGLFRTAGDLGTTAADLAAMATRCRWVHGDERGLADAVARGLGRCVAACVAVHGGPAPGAGWPALSGLRVAVQGCGAIGAAVARALSAAGARLLVADVDAGRAGALADAVGASVVGADAVLTADVDVVAPCATGGVITAEVATRLRAWAVCGAANNVLADADAGQALAARGVLFVPDVVASAGAVIEGIGQSVMGLRDRGPLIDGLGVTAQALLEAGRATGRPTAELAIERAQARLATAGPR